MGEKSCTHLVEFREAMAPHARALRPRTPALPALRPARARRPSAHPPGVLATSVIALQPRASHVTLAVYFSVITINS